MTQQAFDKDAIELFMKGGMVGRYFGATEKGEIDAKTFYASELSRDIRKIHHIITLRDNLDIYIYNKDKGYYEPHGTQLLREIVKRALGNFYSEKNATATINDITASTGEDRAELEPPLYLIPIKNGILNTVTEKTALAKHTPAMFFTGTLPVEYYPEQKCPKILEFLEEVLPNQIERMRLQEHVGYLLYRRYAFQIAVLLIGPEDSGKSTFLALLRRFLGEENISSVELQDLTNDRFAAAELYHKYANICADISKATLRHSGVFKMLTGGDLLDAQKKHRDRFRFVNYAKLWFSANEIPETSDKTNAFFKRWDFFEFPNQFKPGFSDPNKIEEITTPEELSGFLNWALEGLWRLLQNKRFCDLKTLEQRKEIWLLGSSSLYKFIVNCVEEDTEWHETKEDFYSAYIRYCGNHSLSAVDKRVIGKELPRLLPEVREYYKREGGESGKQVKCWKGVKIVGEKPWQDVQGR